MTSNEAVVCETTIQEKPKLEDKIKFKELELHTQYELKYLSDSLLDLKAFVRDNKKADAIKEERLDKKINWIAYIVLAQLAGADVPALVHLLSKISM